MASSDITKLANIGTYDAYFYIPLGTNIPDLANGTSVNVPFLHRYTLQDWTFDFVNRELRLRIAVTDDGPDAATSIKKNVQAVVNAAPSSGTNIYAPSVRNDGGALKPSILPTPDVAVPQPTFMTIEPDGGNGASNQGNYTLAAKGAGTVILDNGDNIVKPVQPPAVAPPMADFGASLILGAIAAIIGLGVAYLVLTKVEEVVESPPVVGIIFIAAAILGLIIYREYRKSG